MRFAFAFGLVVLAATAGAVAPAIASGTLLGQTQVPNVSLPCLGVTQPYAGTTTLAGYQQSATVSTTSVGTKQLQLQLELDLSFTPVDPTLPSYSGKQVVNATLLLSTGYSSSTIPVTIPVTGTDSSTASLSGAINLTISPSGNITSFGSSDWSCGAVLATSPSSGSPAP